jgi:UDP:flavonoid glycosyltransferase YjiC (YdhE family)
MSTFLFVTIDAGGNVPPAIQIGRDLLARGHRVRFLGHERQRAALTAAGFEFSAFGRMPHWDPTEIRPVHRDLPGFLTMCTNAGAGQDLVDLLHADPADLVIIDCMLLSVLQAAHRHAPPYAVLFHSFYQFWDGNFANGPIGMLARVKGLNARTLWAEASLELVVSDPGLDPAGNRASKTRVWCGVTEQAAQEIGRTTNKPTVLVSLSTIGVPGQEDAYRRILQALEDLPLDAVVTTGPAIDPTRLPTPPNAEVFAFTPHAQIMPRVTAVVGHGGHSTTMNALIHGLPMLLMPMNPFIDQSMVSQAVADAGAGIKLNKKASPAAIRRAILDITGTEGFTTAARALGTRLRQTPGASVAADRLLAVLEHPRASN